MAAFVPLKGKFCKINFGTPGDLAGVNWTFNADPKLDDVSNFLTGRLKAATLDDATVTFTAVESDPPTLLGAVKPGDTGTMKLYTAGDLSKWITLPVIIGTMVPKVDDQEKAMRIDITAHLSALWDSQGSTWNNTVTWQATA